MTEKQRSQKKQRIRGFEDSRSQVEKDRRQKTGDRKQKRVRGLEG
ncbi:MAG TPA: hypothetical protein PK661_09110 [Syntrophorhabdaceae bacterium]|nr:hypothetical protein [Syntrophorhabdaceae bacterium]